VPTIRTIAVYLGLALLLTQFHGEVVNWSSRQHKRIDRHVRILEHRGDAPWGYRLLVPYTAEALRTAQAGALPDKLPGPKRTRALSVPLERSYLALRFSFFFGLFVAFHAWLRHWFDDVSAFAGTSLLAAVHGPSFANYWFQPASALDFALWTGAGVALQRSADRWVPLVLLIGALNRETSVFIVLIYGAMRFGTVSHGALLARMAGLGVLWAVPQGLIRWWVGPLGWAGRGATPVDYLTANLTNPDWLTYAAFFWGVLWVVPVFAWKNTPPVLRRLTVVLLPYIALQFLFGRIREVRLFLPLGLVLIPIGLMWLRGAAPADRPATP
jgi:hypothetical protein